MSSTLSIEHTHSILKRRPIVRPLTNSALSFHAMCYSFHSCTTGIQRRNYLEIRCNNLHQTDGQLQHIRSPINEGHSRNPICHQPGEAHTNNDTKPQGYSVYFYPKTDKRKREDMTTTTKVKQERNAFHFYCLLRERKGRNRTAQDQATCH